MITALIGLIEVLSTEGNNYEECSYNNVRMFNMFWWWTISWSIQGR